MTQLLVLVQLVAAGSLILRVLGVPERLDPWARWGWTLLAGQLALAGCAAVVGLTPLPWSALRVIGAVLVGLWLIDLLRRRLRARGALKPAVPEARAGGLASLALPGGLLIALVVVLEIFWASSAELVTLGDESAIWAAKAKVVWLVDGLQPDALQASLGRARHVDYPLLNPLLQIWSFAQDGRVQHAENRAPVQLAMIAITLLLASRFRRERAGVFGGVLLVGLVTSTAFRFVAAQVVSDGLVALGFLATLEALESHRRSKDPRWLRLAMLGLILLVGGKNEGWMLAPVILAAWMLSSGREWRATLRRVFWVALPALFVIGAHVALNRALGVHNDVIGTRAEQGPVQRLVEQASDHLPIVLQHLMQRTTLDPSESHLVFPLGLALLLLFRRRALGRLGVHLLAVGLGLAGYVCVYLLTPHGLEWHLETSLSRLLLHLLPALMAWLGVALATVEFREREHSSAHADAPTRASR